MANKPEQKFVLGRVVLPPVVHKPVNGPVFAFPRSADPEAITLPSANTVTGRICRAILLELARRAGEFDESLGLTSVMVHIKLNGDRVPISIRVSPDYHRSLST